MRATTHRKPACWWPDRTQAKWVEVWSYINRGKIYDIRGQRDRAVTEYQKAINTGDDSYGAQAEAGKYLKEPYRRSGKPTIG